MESLVRASKHGCANKLERLNFQFKAAEYMVAKLFEIERMNKKKLPNVQRIKEEALNVISRSELKNKYKKMNLKISFSVCVCIWPSASPCPSVSVAVSLPLPLPLPLSQEHS